MWIIKYRKIFYTLSSVVVAFSIFAIVFWGIKFGIDFTGGSIIEINAGDATKEEISEVLKKATASDELAPELTGKLGDFSLRPSEENFILRTKEISNEEKNEILNILSESIGTSIKEIRFSTIGPTLGNELASRSVLAIFVVVFAIVIFVAFAFRKVSKPVSSWNYGFVTIVAFLHDVLIPIGLFAVLGQFGGIEVDTLFVVAILVVLGYSINDTIVVFDRIRENLLNLNEKQRLANFEEVVGKSLRETIARSVNTSLTTLLAILAIYSLAGSQTELFALAMIAGVIAGTYSSIFIAAPLLLTLKNWREKHPKKVKKETVEGERVG